MARRLLSFAGRLTPALMLAFFGCDGGSGRTSSADDDTDSATEVGMCSDYPTPDHDFVVGSVVRNYSYHDEDGVPISLCDYAEEGYKLIMISISATDCSACAVEIQHMTAVANAHIGEAKVAEVFEDATDSSQLGQGAWMGVEAFDLLRCEPRMQMSDDYSSATSFAGYPTIPLIDLSTMKVLVQDCWDYPSPGANDLEACVADHLDG